MGALFLLVSREGFALRATGSILARLVQPQCSRAKETHKTQTVVKHHGEQIYGRVYATGTC